MRTTEDKEALNAAFQAFLKRYDTELDAAYAEALRKYATDERAIKFGVDDIPAADKEKRLQELQQTLALYTQRIRTEWEEDSHTPPEEIGRLNGNKFKRDALRRALMPGGVNTFALSTAYLDLKQSIDPGIFGSACGVIHDRVLTGGKRLIGGSSGAAIPNAPI